MNTPDYNEHRTSRHRTDNQHNRTSSQRHDRFARKGVFSSLNDFLQKRPFFSPNSDDGASRQHAPDVPTNFNNPDEFGHLSAYPPNQSNRARNYRVPQQGALRVQHSSRLSYVLLVFGVLC